MLHPSSFSCNLYFHNGKYTEWKGIVPNLERDVVTHYGINLTHVPGAFHFPATRIHHTSSSQLHMVHTSLLGVYYWSDHTCISRRYSRGMVSPPLPVRGVFYRRVIFVYHFQALMSSATLDYAHQAPCDSEQSQRFTIRKLHDSVF
jgi:hypothetical protein